MLDPHADHTLSSVIMRIQILCRLREVGALNNLDIVFAFDNMIVCCKHIKDIIGRVQIIAELVKPILKLSSFYNKQGQHFLSLLQMA